MYHKIQKTRRGFTIAELLISLMILGLLMTGLAVAFNASVLNYHTNKDLFEAMNSGRQALLRITNDLRSAIVNHDEPANQCSMVTSDGRDITYRYDSSQGTLFLDVNSGANAGTYALCNNVTSMSFQRATRTDDITAVRNVRILMTVTVGETSQNLAAGAVVRKNL
jgi:prepilin-type N-terminal cleavage/methylation domain-containing protein